MDAKRLLARTARNRTETVQLDAEDSVVVRGLTRDEVLTARDLSPSARDELLVHLALMDPPLTLKEVKAWSKTGPAGDFAKVLEAIQNISGLGEDARKSAVSEAGE